MSGFDDLFSVYRADREQRGSPLDGDGYAAALAEHVRGTFALIEKLAAEVGKALEQAGYTVRLAPMVEDRVAFMRVDRTSESFSDYLMNWSRLRAKRGQLGMHWEAHIQVIDHLHATGDIGLAVCIERPDENSEGDIAFVEFWTTGKGMALPSKAVDFQRALISSIIRLEDSGVLISKRPRP